MEDNEYGIWIEPKEGLTNGWFFAGAKLIYSLDQANKLIEDWNCTYPDAKHEARKLKSS